MRPDLKDLQVGYEPQDVLGGAVTVEGADALQVEYAEVDVGQEVRTVPLLVGRGRGIAGRDLVELNRFSLFSPKIIQVTCNG